ncbi:hypothetical protein [Micropruina sp.]|uniref:hypothetical protein n=1 Tax=Micropruina sp. TaxID=2737536 RepID=UPI0039E64F92
MLLGDPDAVPVGLAEVVVLAVPLGLAEGLVNRVPVGAGTGTVGSPARSTGADSAWTPATTPTKTATTAAISPIRTQFGRTRPPSGRSTGSPYAIVAKALMRDPRREFRRPIIAR